MEKQVTKKEKASPPVMAKDMNEWGPSTITAKDMVIPKILPLQFMSEKVKNKEGEYGEFRDTLSNKLFGGLDKPFEIIPVLLHKKWMEFEMIPQKGGGYKREYLQSVDIQDNPSLPGFNDDLPLRDEDGNKERDRVMDFFVLIPEEIAAGEATPYVLSFRRTSLKAGQKIATQMFVRNAAAGKVPPATVLEMSGKSKENDQGEFIVQDCIPKRASNEEEINEAFKWFKILKTTSVKVDDSDLKTEEVREYKEPEHF